MKVMITAENAELAQSNNAQENWATRDETIMALDRPCPRVTGPAAAHRTSAHLRKGYSCRPPHEGREPDDRRAGGDDHAQAAIAAELHADAAECNAAEIGPIAHLYRRET
jgi:hypothetical protein